MRKKGENSVSVRATLLRTRQIMISPSVSKVNPFHLADFAAHRDCPRRGESAPVARLKALPSVRN